MVYTTNFRAAPVFAPDLSEIRRIRYRMQDAAKYILHNHRVGVCMRAQIEKYGNVHVWKHRETAKCFYAGLMVCGCVWVCPLCASKISERRRKEIRQAMMMHTAMGGGVYMLTLTFAHTRIDRLADVLDKLKLSYDDMRRQRGYRKVVDRLGLTGQITATEITFGDNGWHPHLHILLLGSRLDEWELTEIEEDIFEIWAHVLDKVDLMASRRHGISLQGAEQADAYVSKWGLDQEIAKAVVKRGRGESINPFDMLRVVAEDGDAEYIERFKEYEAATKGKSQLRWSRGLKGKYLIEEKSDDEIAKEKEEPADLLGRLTWKEWSAVVGSDLRAEFLKMVEKKGFDQAVAELINGL